MVAFAPMGAFSACYNNKDNKGVYNWIYDFNYHSAGGVSGGKIQGWGCKCSESSSGHSISKKDENAVGLYDAVASKQQGKPVLCPFPTYTRCKSNNHWNACSDTLISAASPLKTVIHSNIDYWPLADGWAFDCKSGFEYTGGACVEKKKTCPNKSGVTGGTWAPDSASVASSASCTWNNTSNLTCNSGYTKSGSNCVANSTSTPTTTTTATLTPVVVAPAKTVTIIPGAAFPECGATASSQLEFENCVIARGRNQSSNSEQSAQETLSWVIRPDARVDNPQPVLLESAGTFTPTITLDNVKKIGLAGATQN